MRHALVSAWLAVAAGCTFNPGAAQHSLVQGDMLLVKKDYRGAVGMYDAAVAADPYLREAYVHRGVAHRGAGNFDRALADFDRAIELDPNYGVAFVERARTKLAKVAAQADGDRVRLAEAYSKADPLGIAADLDKAVGVAMLGGDPTAVLLRGAVRLMQERDAEAQQDFDRFLRLRPKAKVELEEVLEKWRRERPVLDLTTLDELCKYRPLKG
jgi:tetratricopeptide (TPR) repeat protein